MTFTVEWFCLCEETVHIPELLPGRVVVRPFEWSSGPSMFWSPNQRRKRARDESVPDAADLDRAKYQQLQDDFEVEADSTDDEGGDAPNRRPAAGAGGLPDPEPADEDLKKIQNTKRVIFFLL